MKVDDEIKICFLPIGTIFRRYENGRVGQLWAKNKKAGETPGNYSNGWFSHNELDWWIQWNKP